jgi:hypothetical protein
MFDSRISDLRIQFQGDRGIQTPTNEVSSSETGLSLKVELDQAVICLDTENFRLAAEPAAESGQAPRAKPASAQL